MEDRLYLIGEFASINKVSARMLRHYDKIGLLIPSSVNKNGYRYYSEQQIATITKVKMLRDCDFSLNEISQMLINDSDLFLHEQIEHKVITLAQLSRSRQKAIELLKGFSNNGKHTDFVPIYGVSIANRKEHMVLISKNMFSFKHVEAGFDKLYDLFLEKHLTASGAAVLINFFHENSDKQNQIGISVIDSYHDEQYQTVTFPSARFLSTIHYGDYYNMGYAYSSMMKYAEQNGYAIDNYFLERYLIDRSLISDPSQYVTEISVPIKSNP